MLIDGKEAACLDPLDRGLHYGDGLFETLPVVHGRVLRWPRHVARLARGATTLGISLPAPELLHQEVVKVAEGAERAVVKLILTRGSGGRGYRPPVEPVAHRLVIRYPWPEYPTEHALHGIRMHLCTTPLGSNPRLAGLKHLNRLEQVLARAEWDDSAVAEGLMRDIEGRPVEGTMSNLFMVQQGVLWTPALCRAGVAGVMREEVLELAASLDISTQITDLSMGLLENADEVFMTNSLIGIWPVRQLGERQWPVGPITRRLQQVLREQ